MLTRDPIVGRILTTRPGGLCLVSAPPGYGATTVMELAAARVAGRVVWLSGDRVDGSPEGFWRHLLAALDAAGVTVPPDLVPVDSDVGGILDALVGPLREAGELVVMVDDVDRTRHADAIAALLAFATLQPATCRTVVRIRGGVPAEAARLVTSGRLVLIDGADLALGQEESAQLVAEEAPRMPKAASAALAELADGWLAPLCAALSRVETHGEDEPAAWLLGPDLDFLYDAEMGRLSQEEQDLLVETAVLDPLVPDACDAIRGRTDSRLLLARIDAAATLVRRAPDAPALSVFLRHPLFAEYLRRRLAQRSREAPATAHAAAADWFLAHGDAELAIEHLHEAGDLPRTMAVLEDHVGSLLEAGRAEVVHRWYASTPGPLVDEQHLHLLGSSWAAMITGDVTVVRASLLALEEAVTELRSASASTRDDPASFTVAGPDWLEAETRLLGAYLAFWSGYPDRAQQLVDAARGFYASSWVRVSQQSAAMLAVRCRLWNDQEAAAGALLSTAARRARTHPYFRQNSIPALRAALAAAEGRAHRASHLAGQALDWLAGQEPFTPFDDLDARLAMAWALTDLDRLTEAEQHARAVVDAGRALRHTSYQVLGAAALARVLAARGAPSTAHRTLEAARDLLRGEASGSALRRRLDTVEAQIRLDVGDIGSVLRLLSRLPSDPATQLIAARMQRSAAGTLQAAAKQITPRTPRESVHQGILLALCHVAGRPGEAEAHLRAAAELAYELGMHRALVGWPAEIGVLAERLAREEGSEALTRLLWVARSPRSAGPAARPVALSRGEVRLLQLLAGDAPNTGIAEDLGVSVNTVKTRLRRLYLKLAVHNRQEAVRWAREHGHLAPEHEPAWPRPVTRR